MNHRKVPTFVSVGHLTIVCSDEEYTREFDDENPGSAFAGPPEAN